MSNHASGEAGLARAPATPRRPATSTTSNVSTKRAASPGVGGGFVSNERELFAIEAAAATQEHAELINIIARGEGNQPQVFLFAMLYKHNRTFRAEASARIETPGSANQLPRELYLESIIAIITGQDPLSVLQADARRVLRRGLALPSLAPLRNELLAERARFDRVAQLAAAGQAGSTAPLPGATRPVEDQSESGPGGEPGRTHHRPPQPQARARAGPPPSPRPAQGTTTSASRLSTRLAPGSGSKRHRGPR